jgi:quinol monooxygenase YgiN
MAFVQIMQVATSNYDALSDLEAQWRAETEGKRTLRRSIVARDRTDPNRYVILAFFDSYESAMENSKLPETQRFATRFTDLADGPLTFQDLDIVEEND